MDVTFGAEEEYLAAFALELHEDEEVAGRLGPSVAGECNECTLPL
jgi:hypothetical protein